MKQEAKIVYLLQCLQKTPPPVLIFAEKKQDVDAIHEYLLLKGVEAVAIHGGKGVCENDIYVKILKMAVLDQEERSRSVEAFRKQEKDVLVATDVASKGLDFPGVQHVINYDMPDDVENYGINYFLYLFTCKLNRFVFVCFFLVHRIGRTGRSSKQGIATTFINKSNDESVLLDLKHLLMEANQKVPPFLAELCSENEKYLNLGGNKGVICVKCFRYSVFVCIADERGCSYCGGLGHRITDCPKLEALQNKQASNIGRRDYLANTAADY